MILGIYGAGGLGHEVLELAIQINNLQNRWKEICFIADTLRNPTDEKEKTWWYFSEIREKYSSSEVEIVIGIGEPNVRNIIRNKVLEHGYSLATMVHPTAHIGANTILESGVVVQYGCFVSCKAKIKTGVFLQPMALIGHNSTVGSDSVISSLVSVAGDCEIGSCSYIGMNVPIKEGIKIGSNVIIGMGSAVLRDIPDNMIALGNPARPMKENLESRVFKSSV